MEDAIIGLVKDVATWAFGPITERISIVYHYNSNVKELKEKEMELETKMETVLHAVEEAERQGDRIEKHVQEWLKKAGDFTEGLAKITNKDEEEKKKKRRFRRFRWLNLKTRYKRSKEAVKLAADVDGLLAERDFQKVAYRTLPERRRSMYVREDDTFDSRESIFNEVMGSLRDINLKIIGVYGTGGVGKTTLVKKVYWQAKEEKLFDQVVMADITQNPDLKKVQGEIAGHLGLVFQEESVDARAARLRKRLEQEKSVLVILDNVWVELDLAAVGIPFKSAEKLSSGDLIEREEDQRQCRILLTCRNLKVCNFMKTEKDIPVMPLPFVEALDLFWRIVADPEKQSEFESIGEKVVEKCGGLPVAIKTIAKTLKHEGHSVWDNAQNQLVNFKFSGVGEDFHSVIELSYKFLGDEEAKSLFLLCGLHGAGRSIGIDYLVKYVMGLGWFQYASTLKDVRGRVDKLIKDLKDASLLLDDDASDDIVKVHDVIHMVARRIGSKSRDKPMFNIEDVKDVKEELEKEMYKDSDAISLPFLDVSGGLPEMPEFPRLKLLLLLMNDHSLKIPDHFFERMKELKVLDLTRVHLPSLSPTLRYLTNLRTLCLEFSQLGDITTVGNLDKLEVLSFHSSDIKKLPEEIGALTRLKLLDLQSCSQLEVIAANVLSKLTRLEELYMGDGFVRWDVQGQDNASLVELTRLYNLNYLKIHVTDAQIMPQDLFPESLQRYVIFIGDVWDWSDKYESSRVLKLKLSNRNFLVYGAKMLLKKTEDLYLDELNGFRNVHPELGGEGFQDLKHLRVQNDPEIVHIVKEEVWDIYNVFLRLESLLLHNLINLKEIYHGQLRAGSFSKLKMIKVEKCNALMHLISYSTAKTFMHLEKIEVIDCKILKEIVSEKIEEDDIHHITEIEFSELHSLTLKCLPEFKSFSPPASIRTIGPIPENDHEAFMTVFGKKVSFPSLRNLNLSSLNIKGIWLDQYPLVFSFGQTLTSLVVEECSGLRFLFSSSMATCLQQLQNLEIANCESMVEIINTHGLEGEKGSIEILFPNLIHLELKGLAALTRFGSACLVEFPCLKRLWIEACPNLKKFVSSSTCADNTTNKEPKTVSDMCSVDVLLDEKVVLLALEELKLSSINSDRIWHDQLFAESADIKNLITETTNHGEILGCNSLKSLKVQNCSRLEYIFTLSMVSCLVHLETMQIENCVTMKEIVASDGDKYASTDQNIFPELFQLYLKQLPELKRFCNSTGNPIQLSSLSDMWIYNCPNMQTFISCSISASSTLQSEEMISENFHAGIIPFFGEKAILPSMKTMTLSCLDSIRKIWQNTGDKSSFGRISWLQIHNCKHIFNTFPSSMLGKLRSLESLKIINCELLEDIFEVLQTGSSSVEKVVGNKKLGINAFPRFVFPKLTSLKLSALPKLRSFYRELHVSEWPMLKELVVCDCAEVELFASEFLSLGNDNDWKNQFNVSNPRPLFILDKAAFPSLQSLDMSYMPKLLHIWKQDNQSCEIFRSLITMKVSKCGTLKVLVPSSVSFPNLATLEVSNCGRLINLVSLSTVKSLVQLTRMEVSNCQVMQECILNNEKGEKNLIVLKKLEHLGLHCLPSLTSFSSGNYDFEFLSIEQVITKQCPNLKIFSPGVVSTPKLQGIKLTEEEDEVFRDSDLNTTIQHLFREMAGFRGLEYFKLAEFPRMKERWPAQIPVNVFYNLCSLVVNDCTRISYAIPTFLLESLNNLEKLDVRDCTSLEAIFNLDEPNTNGRAELLPKLSEFCLVNLPRLGHIQNSNHSLHLCLQNLKKFQVQNCSSLEYLLTRSVVMRLVHLEVMEIENCAMMKEIIANEGEKYAIVDQITFPKLRRMYLKHLPELKRFCNSNGNPIELSSLSDLWIKNCPNMQTFISSSISAPLTLQPEGTISENLHADIIPFFGEKAILPSLETMTLSCLDSVGKIWQNTGDMSSFGSISWLQILNCKHILNIFPSSMFGKLQSLGSLKIINCELLEEIFEVLETSSSLVEKAVGDKELGIDAFPRFVFPKLTSLKLSALPKLRSFYRELHVSEWPMLKELVVCDCAEVELFASEFLSLGNGSDWKNQFNISSPRPLFILDKVGFSDLQDLKISKFPHLKEIWHGQIPVNVFCKVKSLVVDECGYISNTIPTDLLESLNNLEKLEVRDCTSLEAVFDLEEPNADGCTELLPKLSEFCLVNLPMLRCLQKSNFDVSLCFKSLNILKVQNCSSLEYLFTWSVVMRLEHLGEMEIENCAMMKEIIANKTEKDASVDQIIFPKLHRLYLKHLPELKRFCNSNGNLIQLSSLSDLWINDCPNMKTFTTSVISVHLTLHPEDTNSEKFHTDALPFSVEKKSNFDVSLCFKSLKILKVQNYSSLQYLFPWSVVKLLEHLEEMEIENCAMMKEIIANEGEKDSSVDQIIFPKLHRLYLKHLPELNRFCNTNGNPIQLSSLSDVWIYNCPNMQSFISSSISAPLTMQPEETNSENFHDDIIPFFNEKAILPSLESMTLSCLDSLRRIWQNTRATNSVGSIRWLQIHNCKNISNIFPPSMDGRLQRLGSLKVINCDLLEEIFEVHETSPSSADKVGGAEELGIGAFPKFSFPKLTSLKLSMLPRLRSFYPGLHVSEWPMLKELVVYNCKEVEIFATEFMSLRNDGDWKNQPDISNPQPLFILDKVAFPSLEGLDMSKMPKLLRLWKEDHKSCEIFPSLKTMKLSECGNLKILVPSSVFFPNLTTLEVLNCVRLVNLVSSSTAKSLVQLTRVNVSDCPVMQECILHSEEKEKDLIVLGKLQYLGLNCLASLASFCSGNCDFEFPSLVQVTTKQCPKLKIFSPGVVNTPELQSIRLTEGEDETFWEADLNTTIQHLFRKLAGFRGLESLRIAEFPQLKERWPAEIPVRIFCNLRSLEVSDCMYISNAIPTNLLESLNNLEKLDVKDCASLEAVFDSEDPNTDGCTRLLSKFSELHLANLPRLRHIQDSNVYLQLCFKSLKILKVQNCSSLEFLFTWSVGMRLKHLEKIEIENCAMMKEIIVKEGEKDASVDQVIFPKLHRLYLKHLPELKRFCNSNGNPIELSSLSDVWIKNCPNMQTFISSSILMPLSMQPEVTHPENFHADIIPFFSEKAILPSLENMTLSCLDSLRQIWQSTRATNSVGSILWLQIHNCKNISNIFPPSMDGKLQRLGSLKVINCDLLEEIFEVRETSPSSADKVGGAEELGIGAFPKFSFPKLTSLKLSMLPRLRSFYPGLHVSEWPMLKELVVYNCKEVEIFASEFMSLRNDGDWKNQPDISNPQPLFILDKVAFPSLEGLDMSKMPKLLRLSKEDHKSCEIFPSLKTMKLSECCNLKILVPSSVSFPNLTTLEVLNCVRLVNLVSSSTAKSLVQLTRVNVSDCQVMQECILHSEEKEKDLIVLRKLQYLGLNCLASLTSFCSGNCDFEFPSLVQVTTKQCPKLKIFSPGVVSTPELQSIRLTEGEAETFWEADLNTTIQHLFRKLAGFRGLESLRIAEFPQLKERWPAEIPVRIFCNLRSLEVSDCMCISNAIPTNLLESLNNLEKLDVKDCASLEAVFDSEDPNTDGCTKLLSKFSELHLANLPRLRHIQNSNVNLQLCLKNLKILKVQNCGSLEYLFTWSVVMRLEHLEKIEIENCAMMEEIIAKEGEKDASVDQVIFPKLHRLYLKHLPELKRFCNSNGNPIQLSSLSDVWIYNCPNMQSFISSSISAPLTLQPKETNSENFRDDIIPFFNEKAILPSLENMTLSCLDSLRQIWQSTRATNSVGSILWLQIHNCKNISNIFPPSMDGKLQRLGSLKVINCDLLEEIFEVRETSPSSADKVGGAEELGIGAFPKFSFPKLTSLKLSMLPRLRSFYPGLHVSEWPMLKELVVYNCKEVEIFASEFSHLQNRSDWKKQSEISIPQPLFVLDQVAFPSLESLELLNMPKLLHLWKENSQSFEVCPHLITMKVSQCNNLQILVPALVSFPNLRTLEVSNCGGLVGLLSLSTAKSLVEVTRINVSNCKMMKEVIKYKGDEEKDQTLFRQLQYLGLHCLPSLMGFYLGDHTLTFPSLEQLIVRQCPNINAFSQGVVSTPKLQKVKLTEGEDKWRWDGDLNTTIRQLSKKWYNVQKRIERVFQTSAKLSY